jgi:aminopeptidase-like protein
MRTPHGSFPQYHTSADNLDFVQPSLLADSFNIALGIINLLEHNKAFTNQNPKCEPQLGKRGLYRKMGGMEGGVDELALLWLLNLSDGSHSLLEIAERSGYSFEAIKHAADLLIDCQLLAQASRRCTVL